MNTARVVKTFWCEKCKDRVGEVRTVAGTRVWLSASHPQDHHPALVEAVKSGTVDPDQVKLRRTAPPTIELIDVPLTDQDGTYLGDAPTELTELIAGCRCNKRRILTRELVRAELRRSGKKAWL